MSKYVTTCFRLIFANVIPQAPELITAFDEHRVSPNFKFGILCQKEGQVRNDAAVVQIIIIIITKKD